MGEEAEAVEGGFDGEGGRYLVGEVDPFLVDGLGVFWGEGLVRRLFFGRGGWIGGKGEIFTPGRSAVSLGRSTKWFWP